jgi:hypothetical protein
MLSNERTLNIEENKLFQDLIINKNIDLSNPKINLTSLKIDESEFLDSFEDSEENIKKLK